MMRMVYVGQDGREHTEDLVGPEGWKALQYRQAINRQRPGIQILSMRKIRRNVAPRASDHANAWWITLRVPGRPLTTVRQPGGWVEARRLALSSAETTAQIVRMVPAP